MLMVGDMVCSPRPLARGALAALATFAKFAPALLGPMLLTYERSKPPASALLCSPPAPSRRVYGCGVCCGRRSTPA